MPNLVTGNVAGLNFLQSLWLPLPGRSRIFLPNFLLEVPPEFLYSDCRKFDMNCVYCKKEIVAERVELGFNYCITCATKRPIAAYKGIMVFGHKTAGSIQVVSPENFADYRRNNPYGRYTGRGSGIHRVTKTTSCM